MPQGARTFAQESPNTLMHMVDGAQVAPGIGAESYLMEPTIPIRPPQQIPISAPPLR